MNRNLQSRVAGLSTVVLTLASVSAQADVSSTVTVASNYDFRGITQTSLNPAVQASLDWAGESGLYASLWGSNIDFGQYTPENPYIPPPGNDPDPNPERSVDLNVEIDTVLGYAGSFTEDLGYDIGGVYYKYLGNDDEGVNDFDYAEVFTGVGYKIVSAKVWYAWDYGNSDQSAYYAEANVDVPLPAGLGLVLHAGYSGGDYWDDEDIGLDSYYDYSVGLTRSFGRLDFTVKYIDGSDLEVSDGTPDDVFTSESTVFFSVATTFPWGDEE